MELCFIRQHLHLYNINIWVHQADEMFSLAPTTPPFWPYNYAHGGPVKIP